MDCRRKKMVVLDGLNVMANDNEYYCNNIELDDYTLSQNKLLSIEERLHDMKIDIACIVEGIDDINQYIADEIKGNTYKCAALCDWKSSSHRHIVGKYV